MYYLIPPPHWTDLQANSFSPHNARFDLPILSFIRSCPARRIL